MDFGAIDAKPVRLIVLLASPPEKSPDHIQALAQISRMMMNDDFRQKIYAANTPAEIYELIKVQEQGVPTP
jgi:mannitol/fructose-specific phosphotransferase system IIA component (Ntr-type)